MERKKPAAIPESQLGINFIHVCMCTLQSGNGRGRVFYGKQIYVEIAGDPTLPASPPLAPLCLFVYAIFVFTTFLPPSHWTFAGLRLTSYLLLYINKALVNSNTAEARNEL